MNVSAEIEGWLQWMLTTSVPLMRLDDGGNVIGQASGTMVDFEGERFVMSVAHAVPKESHGWAIEIGLDPSKGTEVYHVNAFVYPGEFTRSTATFRELDLCIARVASDVAPWYEFRTPRGLFDKRPRHIFSAADFASPDAASTEAFRGCSGAPMVSTARKIVGLVTSGCEVDNVVRSIAVNRCIPALKFLLAEEAL